MKLSDYVMQFLAKNLGIKHVFMIVGGANAHLADSLAKNKKIKHICTIQEQGAAMAAEGYARITGKMGAVLVTSGPGGTNAITGVCGAWCDSVPVIFISGQVLKKLYTDGKTIRQLGVQQIHIIEIVKPITKYAAMITESESIKYHLEKAAYLAKNGRPGPVWIDVPTDMQHAEIDPDKLQGFKPEKARINLNNLRKQVVKTKKLLEQTKRPILILGYGIRIAGAEKETLSLVNKLGIPVIATWNGIDFIHENHPLYIGRAGVIGQRGANFAIANSDLILAIGSRMDTRQLGNNPQDFYARAAKKIVVDIDNHELKKGLINIDIPINVDAKIFIKELLNQLKQGAVGRNISGWLKRCQGWRKKYPVVLPNYFKEKKYVNSYVFVDALSDELDKNDVIVTDMGTSLTCTMQAFKIKKGQRLFTNTGFASMGFGLPGTIGAWFGSKLRDKNKKRIIGVYGDGGFQMNIKELQTIIHHKIPVKIFLLNNRSYLTIKHTQKLFFNGKIVAADPKSGYSTPNFVKVAKAYGLNTEVISSHRDLNKKIRSVLNRPGPILCEVNMSSNQELIPISMFRKIGDKYIGQGIEDMYPYLSRKEFKENTL